MIIFEGNDKYAYRDPACCFFENKYYLFFTLSEKDSGYMYNRVAMSTSEDLRTWSAPRFITEKDNTLNFCSPGNIIYRDGEYIMCITSYPMPYPYDKCCMADETARLFTVRTKDFVHFSKPELLNPKGDTPVEELGRMIDPYILSKDDMYYLFFKQNGISSSKSGDLKTWEFVGNTSGGENACVIEKDGGYFLIHSPENGIGFAYSKDLEHWEDMGRTTLEQSKWKWAEGRLTAGFAMESATDIGYKYILFFHGSVNVYPETHGNASLALAFTNDFLTFEY